MKYIKFLSVCLLASISMSMSAAVTAQVTFKVQGDLSKTPDYLTITEDDALSSNFALPNTGVYSTAGGNDFSVSMYAVNGTAKCSPVASKSLSNLVIKFEANAYETAYTMSFSSVTGSITLQNEDTSFVIDATKDYKFSCAKSEVIEFTVNPQSEDVYTRTVTSGSYGTICLPWASTKLEGGVFYNVLGEFDANQGVAMDLVTSLQAGYPYVFLANSTEIKVTYDPATEVQTVQYDDNDFYGSFVLMNVPKDNYILMNNLLYKTADATSTIAANRAYFDVENMDEYQAIPGRKVVFMGTEATGLNAVKAAGAKAQKVMINGQMVIIRDGKMFNAQGAEL